MKTYPDGTIIGKYFVSPDQGGFCIRRNVQLPNGKKPQPRYPRSKYRHLKTRSELDALCVRLNHEEGVKAKERVEIETAFIPQDVLDSFRDSLSMSFKNEKDFNYNYNTIFKTYFLNFFVNTLKLPDPKQWHRQQEKWGAALVGKSKTSVFDKTVSSKTIITTIQMGNRFMAFLNQKMPEEYPLVRFSPLTKNSIKDHEAIRKLHNESKVGKFIDLGDWIQINANLPADIAPHIRLLYYYGLRRAESLGFTSSDAVKIDCLTVKAQLLLMRKGEEPVKDKEERDTPHWFCTPALCYRLVLGSLKYKMNPDTLSEKWDKLRSKLGFDYNLHDFRRTFITRALREFPHEDVRRAVGHEDITTTMKYAQDARNLNTEVYKPGDAS